MHGQRRFAALLVIAVLAAVSGLIGGGSTAAAAGGNLVYNGGHVQHNPTYYAIFWLPSGTQFEPGIIGGNAQYENFMARYLQDAGKTNLANVVSQYYDTTSGWINNIEPSTQYGGAWLDTTAYPHTGSKSDPLLGSDIEDAINQALTANPSWKDGINSTFFVFTGLGVESCMNSSHYSCTPGIPSTKGYCAYHNSFTDQRGNNAVFANMPENEYWNALGFFTGEGCFTTNALPNGDIYADNEFSTLSHEQWEAVTDPIPGTGWTDTSGNEIGDKCVGNYGYEPYFGPSNADVNGHLYYLQQEWSNADGSCGGFVGGSQGYYAVYGPYAAYGGASTGDINLAQTVYIPSVGVALAPNPKINWGDGTTVTCNTNSNNSPSCKSWGATGCLICTIHASHTYAYDASATSPQTYTVTVTYHTGCCIKYSQSLHIVVFPPTPLKITANNQTMTYGGTVPSFTASYSGFVNGDTSSVVQGLTCGATDASGNPVSSATPPGTYTITCSGATAPANYIISYVSGTLTINKATTTTTVSSSDNSSVYGQPVTFTATVSSSAQTPTGTVTFYDGASDIGSAQLAVVNNSDQASLTLSNLAVSSSHSITAHYGGDNNFDASTSSPAISQIVNKASTTTKLSSQPDPSVFGQAVTFTASISVTSPGAGSPSGTVSFTDGGVNIPTCASQPVDTSTETATCTTSSLSVATHNVAAAYSGDNNFDASTSSPAISQIVNKASTTTKLSSQPDPSVFGQAVTFTASISVTSPGAGSPSGTVSFTDGGVNIPTCASQPVDTSTETATCTTSSLSVATHNVAAAYSGDNSFVASHSADLTQTVNKASTSTSISSSANPSVVGQTVTFTATVAATAPGAGNPTGMVTFSDGSTILGTEVLSTSGGVTTATFSTSSLAVGPHSITVSYPGDGNFLPSSSSALTQYVNTNLSSYPTLPNGAYDLSNTNLVGGYFVEVDLSGADLSNSNFTGATFIGANLTGADLSSSNFKGANFTDAQLLSANMSNSNFKGANFTDAQLLNANMSKSNFMDAVFSGADLSGADLSGANMKGVIGYP